MSLRFSSLTLWSVIFLLGSSCANYNLHTSTAELTDPATEGIPAHSIYLIGSTGMVDAQNGAALDLLGRHLKLASKKSSVVFLGDQTPNTGMPPGENERDHARAQRALDQQLTVLKNFPGRPYFIPGDRDWKRYGVQGVRRQEAYVEAALNANIEDEDDWKNHFRPDKGCGDPEVRELTENLVLVLIDSQWWLENWNKDPNVNVDCDVAGRDRFRDIMADIYDEYEDRNIVVATHHGIRSGGPHGGATTLQEHLFPLASYAEGLYLPLPGLGSVIAAIDKSGVDKQDLANPTNKRLQDALLGPHGDFENLIFVSAQDHSLQYHRDENHHITSGSGSMVTPTMAKKTTQFSQGVPGFARLDFYADGTTWLEFRTVGDDPMGELAYRRKIKDALPPKVPPAAPQPFPEYEARPDSSVLYPITFPIRDRDGLARWVLGDHHRESYLEQVNFPVLDLSAYDGGLTVIKKGGGKQTNSLRLRNDRDQEYVLRSLTKDPKTVPYPFNQMKLVNNIFQETYIGSTPYASLTVPVLADAARVYHTNPNLYYVPKQPALEGFNEDFGGEVYLLEERPSKDRSELASFANADKFISTLDLVAKQRKNQKHRVDQRWVARSRLFDLLIGDFDRHDDQWRWARVVDEDDYKLYRPIPRDRDHVFARYDGALLGLTSPYHPLLRQLTDYNAGIDDYSWATFNTRFFDHDFLNEITLEQLLEEARFIQENVTDAVIEEAFQRLPPEVREILTRTSMGELKRRRDNLPDMARQFYEQLNELVVLHGSDKGEYFEIVHRGDGRTEVNIFDRTGEYTKGDSLYHRIFRTSETKEVLIYGLDGNDVFHFSGTADSGVRIRAIGGQGEDRFTDVSKVGGIQKVHHIYDSRERTELDLNGESRDRTSDITHLNTYDRLGHHLDQATFTPYPALGVNVDDGVLIGARGEWIFPGYQKKPYNQRHSVGLSYATATQGLALETEHEFIQAAMGLWDILANTEFRNGRYAFNFFGLGNDANGQEDVDINRGNLDFYRVRQSLQHVDVGLQRRFGDELGRFVLGALVEGSEIEETAGRFIAGDANGLPEDALGRRLYLGLFTELHLESVDNVLSPRDGFAFQIGARWQSDQRDSERDFTRFTSDLRLYKSLNQRRNLVLATRVGGAFVGGDADFFYLPALGQLTNLRGYFRDRFRGDASFYHQTDLRLGLGSWNNPIVPMTFGIGANVDYGRVWFEGQDSDVWHSSVGGSVFLIPLNLAVVSINYSVTNDNDALIQLRLGHAF